MKISFVRCANCSSAGSARKKSSKRQHPEKRQEQSGNLAHQTLSSEFKDNFLPASVRIFNRRLASVI
jgi:hypothetical protein